VRANPQSAIHNPKWIVHRLESVTSTNDVAVRMAREGAPEGTVVVAREQTAGRGRHGRSWSSPPGGLYLSIIFRPHLPFEDLWQMAFLAAVASAEAVGQVSGLPARIKWPNDVLLNARKVCGILIEAPKPAASKSEIRPALRTVPPTDGAAFGRHPATCVDIPQYARRSRQRRENPKSEISSPVVVGIGINVNNQEFDPEISQTATSIALEAGRQIAVEEVEEALLPRLDARYSRYVAGGFGPILREWRNLDCTAGREVAVSTAEGVVEGRAVEIDPRGNLVIEHEDGTRTCVAAGDVIIRDT